MHRAGGDGMQPLTPWLRKLGGEFVASLTSLLMAARRSIATLV